MIVWEAQNDSYMIYEQYSYVVLYLCHEFLYISCIVCHNHMDTHTHILADQRWMNYIYEESYEVCGCVYSVVCIYVYWLMYA